MGSFWTFCKVVISGVLKSPPIPHSSAISIKRHPHPQSDLRSFIRTCLLSKDLLPNHQEAKSEE